MAFIECEHTQRGKTHSKGSQAANWSCQSANLKDWWTKSVSLIKWLKRIWDLAQTWVLNYFNTMLWLTIPLLQIQLAVSYLNFVQCFCVDESCPERFAQRPLIIFLKSFHPCTCVSPINNNYNPFKWKYLLRYAFGCVRKSHLSEESLNHLLTCSAITWNDWSSHHKQK